jgi:tetrahydromethanopterin S-methyltransferase subunit F
LNWAGGSTYAATSVVNDVRYATNFFTDEGTVIKSGTAQTTVELAIVDNVTS